MHMLMASTGAASTASSEALTRARAVMDERRRKRRQSNRDSARRSRARRLKQLDELTEETEALRGRNDGLAAAVRAAERGCAALEAENVVLRARALELGARLQSLTGLLHYMNTTTTTNLFAACTGMRQPIMASTDMYNYYY